jgi:hypothetical protein
MHQDIRQLKISVHNLVFNQGLEGIENLNKELDCLLFVESLFLFEIGRQIALIAILQNEIEVIGRFFNIVKLDNVAIVTGFEDLDLVFEEFHKLA